MVLLILVPALVSFILEGVEIVGVDSLCVVEELDDLEEIVGKTDSEEFTT